jgi:hypothetical protein
MNSLLTLDLSGNQLGGKLDSGSFTGLGSLQEVRLARNGITEVRVNHKSHSNNNI